MYYQQLDSVWLISFLSSSALLCSAYSGFLCSWLEREAPEQTPPKGSLFSRVRKCSHPLFFFFFLPLSDHLPHIPSLRSSLLPPPLCANNASSLFPSPHAGIPQRGAANLSPSIFLYPPPSSLPKPSSFPASFSQMGDLIQHPHYSDFTTWQLQSRPQSRVLAERTINAATVSGDKGARYPGNISHLIDSSQPLWVLFVTGSRWKTPFVLSGKLKWCNCSRPPSRRNKATNVVTNTRLSVSKSYHCGVKLWDFRYRKRSFSDLNTFV